MLQIVTHSCEECDLGCYSIFVCSGIIKDCVTNCNASLNANLRNLVIDR